MTYKILLIDHNDEQREFLSALIERQVPEGKLELTQCKSYETAFGHLFSKNWDLILVDGMLPSRNAVETLRTIKSILNNTQTRTILFSPSHLNLQEKALEEGATDFLTREEMVQPKGIARIFSHLENQSSGQASLN